MGVVVLERAVAEGFHLSRLRRSTGFQKGDWQLRALPLEAGARGNAGFGGEEGEEASFFVDLLQSAFYCGLLSAVTIGSISIWGSTTQGHS